MPRYSAAEFEALRAKGLTVVQSARTPKPRAVSIRTPAPERLDAWDDYERMVRAGMAADAAKAKDPRARNASGNLMHPDDPWSYGPCTMPGQLCSKSNSRKIVRMGNRIAVIKSAEARAYVDTFLRTMPKPAVPFEGRVCFKAHVYYADRRRDLDIALIQDCLQAHGIIKNDRQVVEIHAFRSIDKEQPRTWFLLTASDDETLG